MSNKSTRIYSIALILGDFFTLLLAFTVAYILRVQFDTRPLVTQIHGMQFIITALILIPFWLAGFASLGLYTSRIYTHRLIEIGKLFVGTSIGILILIGYAFVIDQPIFPARLVVVYAFIASFLLLVLDREILRYIRTLLFRYGKGISRVLVIGVSDTVADIVQQLSDTKKSGYHISAIAGPKKILPAKSFYDWHYSSVESALKDLKKHHITTIIQTDLYEDSSRNQAILNAAQSLHINYSFIPGESEFYSGKNTIDVFLGYPIISVHQTPLVGWGEVVKRLFDVIAVSLGLIVLSPLFAIIIVLQKVLNPGPIFYGNKRLTRYGKPFKAYKFRSMRPEFGKKDAIEDFKAMGRDDLAEEYRVYRKVVSTQDPRITKFGHFLRETSLDELPQLYNVLRGDMSLVGPRPIEPIEIKNYHGRSPLLHSVRPGITGLWQVSGRNELSFDQRVDLELYYAQNWSFWLDLKILIKTIPVLFNKTGAR